MGKQEFLDTLRKKLAGELSQAEVNENIQYYDSYISSEMNKGRSEQEVIEEIGSPLLVAKTIIDTRGYADKTSGANHSHTGAYNNPYSQNQSYEHSEENYRTGKNSRFYINRDQNGWDVRYGRMKLNTWYFKLLAVVIILLIAITIFRIVGTVISFLVPFVLPILIFFIVYSAFTSGRRR